MANRVLRGVGPGNYWVKIVAILVINFPIFEDQNNLFDALSGCFSIKFRPISIEFGAARADSAMISTTVIGGDLRVTARYGGKLISYGDIMAIMPRLMLLPYSPPRRAGQEQHQP
jgi:hypothetical protein